MAKIKIFDAMAGCKLIQCGDEVILAGIPPEVIKAIKLKNLPFPTALLIPDKLIIANNLQNSTEFPLYHFLFFCDGIKNKKKLKILGHSQHVKNNRELLRLTLFGPRADELLKIGIEESLIEMFQKELQFFQKENNSNSLLDISNYLEEYIFDGENKIFFENISISRIGFNKYVFEYDNEKVEINLNTTEEQLPPYYVQIDCTPNELCKFGIEILGGATGFSASSASSGLVFVYNGNYILIDSIPFIDYHLVARGVAKSQIKSMFLSHIHDDHCNLLSLMFGVNKIKIITTKEIYWMAMYKMSLMLNLPMQEVMMYFDLVPLTVGKTLDYYGFKIKPHYTVHTIPTIGATFSIRHNNLIYSTVITGDNQNLSDLQKMLDENIITQDRAGKIKELYLKETDLLIADGGEGLIHGTPRDALLSQANRVVFFHLDALPPEFNSTFSVATAGKRYVIIQGSTDYYLTRSIEFIIQHFNGFDPGWISIIMGNMEVSRYNTDDVIIKQGAVTKNKIYIIITGHCSIIIHDGKKPTEIAKKEAGDLFGEMAITTGMKLRNASVIARSPVTLCELSEEIFYGLILKEKFKDTLLQQWEYRDILSKLDFFKTFSHQILDRLAKYAIKMEYSVNEDLSYNNENSIFYIIIDGVISKNDGSKTTTLSKGDYFGDYGFGQIDKSKYTVKSNASCLIFQRAVIKKILIYTPQLLFSLKNKHYIFRSET